MRMVHRTSRWCLSFLVVFSMLLSMLALPVPSYADTVTNIGSQSDLELIRSNPGGDFKLTADIALTGMFVPIPAFSGTLDGDGHILSGLAIAGSSAAPRAAFIIDNSGIIEKIGFIDVTITSLDTNSTYRAGGIVESNHGTIRQSFVTGSVTGAYRSAGIAVTNYGLIQDVYAAATVSAKWEAGGLVAVSEGGSTLASSYAIPNVHSAENNTGGIAAYAYTNAVIRDNALLAGTIANDGGSNIARIVGRLNGTPTLQNNIASSGALVQGAAVTGGTLGNNQGLSVSNAELTQLATYEQTLGWDFFSAWEMSAVLERPILRQAQEAKDVEIDSAADLELIRGNPDGDFKLTADIALTGTFVPIPTFSGTLDGNGYAISGLTIVGSATEQKAAFIVDNEGIIERIGFANAAVIGSDAGTGYWAGGIAASNHGTIRESFVTGMIVGGYRSGGLVAHNYGSIQNSYVDAIVKAGYEAGALVAVSEGGSTLETSYAIPNVYSAHNNTGGITGYAYTNAVIHDNALLAGTIANDGGSNIARIVGRMNGTPTLQNNIASSGALVQGAAVSGGTLNNKQGLAVTNTALGTQSTYESTLDWDFNSVWQMNATLGRPVLKFFASLPSPQPDAIVYRTYRETTNVLADGVSHQQMDFIDRNGNIQKANVINIDLTLPENSIIVGTKNNQVPPTDANGDYIRTVDGEGHDVFKGTIPVQAATTVIAGHQVVAGVNGEFYTEQGPEGYMIKDGSSVINGVRVPGADSKTYPFHGFFGIKDDGTPMIGDYGDDWEDNKDDLFQASGGEFRMVIDGVVQNFSGQVISNPSDPNYDQETYYRHKDRHPRTAVGIRSDVTVFFVTVDGRGANRSTGFYIEELGEYMKTLGADQALNMDGGGSSTAVTLNATTSAYEVQNTPINKVDGVSTPGALREVFSSLLVLVEQP